MEPHGKDVKSSVIGIIFDKRQSHVLTIKRRDVPVWVLPGGGVDDGETPDQAVIREIHEETGFDAKIIRKIGEYTPINRLSNFTHVYECKIVGGQAARGDETRDIGFHPIMALPDSFFIVHRDWLEDALNNEPKTLSKPITRVTYFALFKYFCRHPLHVMRFALSKLGFPINSK